MMRKVKISDFAEVITGGTPSTSVDEYWDNGTIPWLQSGACQNCVITTCDTFITEDGLNNSATKMMKPESVLIALTGATTGKVGYLTFEACANQSVTGIQPNDMFVPKYLYYYLMGIRQKILDDSYGGAQKHISQKYVQNLEVPLGTISEQNAIASTIEKVDAVISARKNELQMFDDLIKARFVEMFGDFKINSMGWPVVGFDEIAMIDGNMTTDYERYADYPHIGIDSIEKDTGLLKGYRTVAEDGVISGKYLFTPAHIIYSKIRPNLNKVALPDFEGLCSADAYPILPISGKCNRVFLAYDMRSVFFLDYILQFCNRTNLPKVNRKEVAGFRTPLPPIELQEEFAAFVTQVDKSKAAVQKALDEAQLLFDSLMQKYFG